MHAAKGLDNDGQEVILLVQVLVVLASFCVGSVINRSTWSLGGFGFHVLGARIDDGDVALHVLVVAAESVDRHVEAKAHILAFSGRLFHDRCELCLINHRHDDICNCIVTKTPGHVST